MNDIKNNPVGAREGESINKIRLAMNRSFLKVSGGFITRAYYIILFTFM